MLDFFLLWPNDMGRQVLEALCDEAFRVRLGEDKGCSILWAPQFDF